MSGIPGTNWNGHLPSNRMEREILNAIDAIEDEEGAVSTFMTPREGPLETHVRQSQGGSAAGAKAVLHDHAVHAKVVLTEPSGTGQVRLRARTSALPVTILSPDE